MISWDGEGGLGTHIIDCSNQVLRQPTFVLVDFFNMGPAIEATDIMNKVQRPVGRKGITEKATAEFTSAAGPVRVSSPALVLGGLVALVATLL